MLFPLERQGQLEQPNKLTFSAYATAVLIELLHRQRDAFGLSLISASLDLHTPCRSSRLHQQYLLGELDRLVRPTEGRQPPQRTTAVAEALHLVAERLHRRSLVVIFTDALVRDSEQEPLFDALRHLRHNKHEVILFHTHHRDYEQRLGYDARPHLFIDLENGRQLRLNPAEVAITYQLDMNHLFATLQQRALQYRIDYVPVDVAQGFHQVMLPFLLKRNKTK